MTLVLIVPGWLWLCWQYLSPISKNNETDNANDNDRRGGVAWTWAGVRKAVMADGDGRREVDIIAIIVICHFSTLMLNYILYVQLHTVCVGFLTVFKAVPSTYPADNFRPVRIVYSTQPPVVTNIRLYAHRCWRSHPPSSWRSSTEPEWVFFMAHYSINYLCICKHKLRLNSQQNSLKINFIFLKAWSWG